MLDVWEEYKKLYHYTNWDGLIGILNTKSLWATHCRFLNDSSEFQLFRDKLISLLERAVRDECEEFGQRESNRGQRAGHAANARSFAAAFVTILVNNYYRVTEDEIYIASFCGHDKEAPYTQDNGLLSQWRAYGAGGGFALVFDTPKLRDLLQTEAKRFGASAMHLNGCVYSDDEDGLEREFTDDIDTLSKSARRFARLRLTRKVDQHDQETLYRENLWPFVYCCSLYKHFAFKEEKEVRLVVATAPHGPSLARRLRDKNGERIPYVSLFDSTGLVSEIERIIVGPHKEKMARAAALRVVLGNVPIEVTCSDIPFFG